MSRLAICADCRLPIHERGNEIPYQNGFLHRQCYARLQQENPEELPTLEQLQKDIDGVRSPRL